MSDSPDQPPRPGFDDEDLSHLARQPRHKHHRRYDHGRGGKLVENSALARQAPAKAALLRAEADLPRELARARCAQLDADAAAQLVADVATIYQGMRRDIDCDSPSALLACAQFARSAVLATFFHGQAVLAGLDTPRGMSFVREAQRAYAIAELAGERAMNIAQRVEGRDHQRAIRAAGLAARVRKVAKTEGSA